jgi:DNA-binding HxlR family transcriptional regulator
LRDLERDGLITRHVFPTKPPGVEYRLAPLGQSLLEPMAGLIDWADRCYGDIHAARARFDGTPGDASRQAFPAPSKVPFHGTNRQR